MRTIDLSVIHNTVRPDASTNSAQGTQSVSKGVGRLMIGLRYLSPNGRFVTNYGMLNNKILTGLLLCVAIWQPQYVLAASFCATSPEGKILLDECKYDSYDACKRVIGSSGDCVSNQGEKLAPAKLAPYCVVVWSTECKYYDYETCNQAAKTQMGFCYLNPDYKKPDK